MNLAVGHATLIEVSSSSYLTQPRFQGWSMSVFDGVSIIKIFEMLVMSTVTSEENILKIKFFRKIRENTQVIDYFTGGSVTCVLGDE